MRLDTNWKLGNITARMVDGNPDM